MGTGPAAEDGFDLAMTEIRAGFIVHVGSQRGGALLDQLHVREASTTELELADIKLQRARDHMGRELNTEGVKQLLFNTIEHPHWDDIAKRCLGCGNCTMVCPTCFCSTVTDGTDVSGAHIERTRQWESCFAHQFSYTTAGAVRATIRGRYRHWLRHKLGTWWDQFGTSGCVGCGRCITWCPVGIDLTREIEALRGPLPMHQASAVEMSIAKEASS
jgi:ferredoxin